jgi:translation elongation factor EF-Ts
MKIKITKEDCENLRKDTGYSLMDCKYGLIKANGDRIQALVYIQNKLKYVLK